MQELSADVLSQIVPFSGNPNLPVAGGGNMLAQGQPLQQTKTAYTTAVTVQKPRQISTISSNVLQESKLAGSHFFYRWEVFDKTKNCKVPIIGPSIDLAMCIARNYGNCVLDVEATETPTHYMLKGVFIDLETGFTCPRLFRQRKKQNISGKMDADRQEDMVFQIGQSKAIRNAIVKAMPAWLIDKAIETAMEAEVASIKPENLPLARSKVISFFSQYGVTADEIAAERNRQPDQWTAKDIVELRATATAIKEGRVTAQEIFKTKPEEPTDGTDGPNTNGDTAGNDDNGSEGLGGAPGGKETSAQKDGPSEQSTNEKEPAQGGQDIKSQDSQVVDAEFEGPVRDAIDWCKNEAVKKRYKGPSRTNVEVAIKALGIQWDGKDYIGAHNAIKTHFGIEDVASDDQNPAGAGGNDPPPNNEYLNLLDKFNETFAGAQQDAAKLMPIFKAALNAANIPTGQRPADVLQAETFFSSYENILKSDQSVIGLSKDAEIEQEDKGKIWDALWEFINKNHPQWDFHMFKNFLGIHSSKCGVPDHELAKQMISNEEHHRLLIESFNKWRNVDKF